MAVLGFIAAILFTCWATIASGFFILFGGFELGSLLSTNKMSDKVISISLIAIVSALWYLVIANAPFQLVMN